MRQYPNQIRSTAKLDIIIHIICSVDPRRQNIIGSA